VKNYSEVIRKNTAPMAPKILLIGVEGVGKTSAGAQSPNPIFLTAEDGLSAPELRDIPHHRPENWTDAVDFVRWLGMPNNEHGYESIVIDTVDWLEPILFAHVAKEANKKDIESIGYGKGYVEAADQFRAMLCALDRCRARGMLCVILAHCMIKNFKNPLGEDYDRYEMKANKHIAPLCKEWADAVFFARYEIALDDGKAYGGKTRVIETEHSSAWDAKNRYSLPEQIPLKKDNWPDILKMMTGDKELDEAINLLPESRRDAARKAALKNRTTVINQIKKEFQS